MPSLRDAFSRVLEGKKVDGYITPERAQLYVAMGAALTSTSEPIVLAETAKRSRHARTQNGISQSMPPLFRTKEELAEFNQRHSENAAD